jgi:hypothetical protein
MTKLSGASDLLKGCGTQRDNQSTAWGTELSCVQVHSRFDQDSRRRKRIHEPAAMFLCGTGYQITPAWLDRAALVYGNAGCRDVVGLAVSFRGHI